MIKSFTADVDEMDLIGFASKNFSLDSNMEEEVTLEHFKELTAGWSCKFLLRQSSTFALCRGSAAVETVSKGPVGDELDQAPQPTPFGLV